MKLLNSFRFIKEMLLIFVVCPIQVMGISIKLRAPITQLIDTFISSPYCLLLSTPVWILQGWIWGLISMALLFVLACVYRFWYLLYLAKHPLPKEFMVKMSKATMKMVNSKLAKFDADYIPATE